MCISLQLLFLEVLLNIACGNASLVNCQVDGLFSKPAAKMQVAAFSLIVSVFSQVLNLK